MEVNNKYITIKNNISGAPKESDFEIKNESLSLSVEQGDVIVKNLYVSIDPYQINRMKTLNSSQQAITYSVAITPGEAIDTYGVGRVVVSDRPEFKKGDLVTGLLSWGEYTRMKEGILLNKLELMGFPLSNHVGVFGFSGLAAYGGFFEVCKPKKGEKVFVSAACGSVGHLVGQYAKLFGCYVVGSAGTQQKVQLLKEKLGFDDAFNYKEESDLNSCLRRFKSSLYLKHVDDWYFSEGIDIYFDNVGGRMLEAAVANMNMFGRIAVCGVVSEYTNASKRAAFDMMDVVYKRITIQGFLAADHFKVYADFQSKTAEYLRGEKLKAIEDVSQGVESIPSAFIGLFRGDNVGKKIVQVADHINY